MWDDVIVLVFFLKLLDRFLKYFEHGENGQGIQFDDGSCEEWGERNDIGQKYGTQVSDR